MFSHDGRRYGVDRCALFVDASYVLADGAMAVHGTRRRESVSWDYAGLVQFLGGMAKEQSGLPLLRCYWYEATVEGRRSAEHDTLADLPGVKLRLAKMRPGRREGVESEIHRDITTLARNKAVTDAVVLSAEEDLAQVVADVQDLGMRVTLLHIAVPGNGTVPRSLRQECDDIVEVNNALLRPYVELISGAEPARPDERDGAPVAALRPTMNGRGQVRDTTSSRPRAAQEAENDARQALPSGFAPPAAAAAAFLADSTTSDSVPEPPAPPEPSAQPDLFAGLAGVRRDVQSAPQEVPAEQDQGAVLQELPATATTEYLGVPPDLAVVRPEQAQVQPPYQEEYVVAADLPARQDLYSAPDAVPALPDAQPVANPAPLPARGRAAADLSGYNPGAMREQPPRDAMVPESLTREPGESLQPVPAAPARGQVRRLPTRNTDQQAQLPQPSQVPQGGQPAQQAQPVGVPHLLSAPTAAPAPPAPPPTAAQPMPPQPMPMPPGTGQPGVAQTGLTQPGFTQPGLGQPAAGPFAVPPPEAGQAGGSQPVAPVMPMDAGPTYTASRNGSYGPGGPTGPAAGPSGLAAPPGAQQAGLGGQGAHAGPGFDVPTLSPPTGGPAGAVNGTGQPVAYTQGTGGPGSPAGPGGFGAPGGGPVGPLGQAGPGYSGAPTGGSLADAVQSAHQEGQEFGESIARDAPALWLEAVLARKPRMPSDLEARLLQGSALPIDYLLHDEVRHALRRGFWDALERARR
jgi:uncharacterized LabA/DUF88 family protein